MPKSVDILMISRGRGRGHAIPDMAIASRVVALRPNVQFQFVSYNMGAQTYRSCGYEVLDLGLPENPSLFEMIITYTRLLTSGERKLVVAHEEFAALIAAKILELPSLFITDFFTDAASSAMQALRYASEIIFTSDRGLYTEPPHLRGKVSYVGPAIRHFNYKLEDGFRARMELGIPQNAVVAFFQPGTWTEARFPLAELLLTAWDLVQKETKRLIWLAGDDYERLRHQYDSRADLILLKEDWNIDRLMAASDILITKANRMTVYEAAALGLPSISLSTLANWPDDVAVDNIVSNAALRVPSLTPQQLAEHIVKGISMKPNMEPRLANGTDAAANRILYHLDSLSL
jgi:hypothetical protein